MPAAPALDRLLASNRIRKNPETAAHWNQSAAADGHPAAQARLGYQLATGIGLLYATPSNAAPDCVNVRKSAPDMAEATIDAVRRASDLLQKKQTDDAITKLNGFISRGEPIDKAMIYFNLGVAYSEKEQYLDAAKAFATAIGFLLDLDDGSVALRCDPASETSMLRRIFSAMEGTARNRSAPASMVMSSTSAME